MFVEVNKKKLFRLFQLYLDRFPKAIGSAHRFIQDYNYLTDNNRFLYFSCADFDKGIYALVESKRKSWNLIYCTDSHDELIGFLENHFWDNKKISESLRFPCFSLKSSADILKTKTLTNFISKNYKVYNYRFLSQPLSEQSSFKIEPQSNLSFQQKYISHSSLPSFDEDPLTGRFLPLKFNKEKKGLNSLEAVLNGQIIGRSIFQVNQGELLGKGLSKFSDSFNVSAITSLLNEELRIAVQELGCRIASTFSAADNERSIFIHKCVGYEELPDYDVSFMVRKNLKL